MSLELISEPYPISRNPVEPYQRQNLPGVMVDGDWTDELQSFYQEKQIKAVFLNSSRGWTGSDYGFLAKLPWLRSLSIIAGACDDLSAAERLTNLVELSIGCSVRKPINFTELHLLRRCFLEWWPGATSIFDCSNLQSLYIHKLSVKHCGRLMELRELRDLTVYSQSIQSLTPITGLAKLEKLELLGCQNLKSIGGIEELTSLRSLTLNGCGLVTDLSPLSELRNLEHLVLSDWKEIDTLTPIRNLERLRAFAFSGARTMLVDGDLSPLEELPELSMLMFGARRHYTHKIIKPWNWNNFYEPDTLLERKSK